MTRPFARHTLLPAEDLPPKGFAAFAKGHLAAALATLLALVLFGVFAGAVRVPEWTIASGTILAAITIALIDRSGRRTLARIISALSFALLISVLAAFTGGIESPFLVWFALAPINAALERDRLQIILAALAAAAGAGANMWLGTEALLPLPAVPEAYAGLVAALSAFGAIACATLSAFGIEAAERRQTRRAEEGEARFRVLAEEGVDLITRHDPDGTINFASPASLTLLGRPPRDLVNLSPLALVHPADNARLRQALERASQHGEAASVDLRFIHANGEAVYTELRCRPIAPEKGQGWRGFGVIAVTRDMTERRRHEVELTQARDSAEAANRAKSRFLANMSHELRTPLNAIIGFSDVMRAEMFGALGNARYREYAGLIHDSGQHLLDLIADVLDMSKIEAGKYELAFAVVDLPGLIGQVMETMRLAAERAGVRLSADVPDPCPKLKADRRALRQILLNLLSNAVKFTPRGGEVGLTLRSADGGVSLVIHDSGIGIAPADLARLGRPFEQASGAYERKESGTGLGLALVKSLTEMHGGTMKIESALGHGTQVELSFPVEGPAMREASAGNVVAISRKRA